MLTKVPLMQIESTRMTLLLLGLSIIKDKKEPPVQMENVMGDEVIEMLQVKGCIT